MDAETILAGAALRLTTSHPYLGSALWGMRRAPAPGLGTMAVDAGWRLYFDPATVEGWTVAEVAGVLYHEVCHLLRDHAARRPAEAAPRTWNIACDAEINDDLRDEAVTLPAAAIYPAAFGMPDGRLAEEYWLGMPKQTAAGNVVAIAGWCQPAPAGLEAQLALRDAGLSPGEAQLVRRDVARAIREHRGRGTAPGHLQRWAEAMLEPRIDWRHELASHLRQATGTIAGMCDYSYARPSRRHGSGGSVVFPALVRPEVRVAIVVDTSGSMGTDDLAAALGEVQGILAAATQREPAVVLAVDAAVQATSRAFRASDVRLAGGGGTDMGAGFAAAAQLHPRPHILVVITDGYTPWPAAPLPGIETIVVLIGHGARTSAPAWARTIRRDAA